MRSEERREQRPGRWTNSQKERREVQVCREKRGRHKYGWGERLGKHGEQCQADTHFSCSLPQGCICSQWPLRAETVSQLGSKALFHVCVFICSQQILKDMKAMEKNPKPALLNWQQIWNCDRAERLWHRTTVTHIRQRSLIITSEQELQPSVHHWNIFSLYFHV